MLTMQESIVIDRPREEVWEQAVDPSRRLLWMTNIIEFEPEGGDRLEPGDRIRVVAKIAGRRIKLTEQVTEAVPGESFDYRGVEGPFEYAFTFRFEDTDGGGTHMTISGESPGLGGVFGTLGDPLVVRLFSRDVRSNLDNLKTLIEAGVDA